MARSIAVGRRRRVVISGMGAVSAAGLGVTKLWNAARDGVLASSAAETRTSLWGTGEDCAQVPEFDPAAHIESEFLPFCDPFTQYAIVAADEAMATAGFAREDIAGSRTAVVIGTGDRWIYDHRQRQLQRICRARAGKPSYGSAQHPERGTDHAGHALLRQRPDLRVGKRLLIV